MGELGRILPKGEESWPSGARGRATGEAMTVDTAIVTARQVPYAASGRRNRPCSGAFPESDVMGDGDRRRDRRAKKLRSGCVGSTFSGLRPLRYWRLRRGWWCALVAACIINRKSASGFPTTCCCGWKVAGDGALIPKRYQPRALAASPHTLARELNRAKPRAFRRPLQKWKQKLIAVRPA